MVGTDQRLKLVIGGAVVLLVLITLATFFFISRAKQEIPAENNRAPLASLRTITNPNQTNSQISPTDTTNSKIYSGQGFALKYPQGWGLLTCSNSYHLEFDPNSSTDTTIACDRAVKPVTVLVTPNLNCKGELITLGSYQVLKTKSRDNNGDVDYQWCVSLGNGSALDITHRVSQGGLKATSKIDLSTQVEEIIRTLSN